MLQSATMADHTQACSPQQQQAVRKRKGCGDQGSDGGKRARRASEALERRVVAQAEAWELPLAPGSCGLQLADATLPGTPLVGYIGGGAHGHVVSIHWKGQEVVAKLMDIPADACSSTEMNRPPQLLAMLKQCLSGSSNSRAGAGVPLSKASRMPSSPQPTPPATPALLPATPMPDTLQAVLDPCVLTQGRAPAPLKCSTPGSGSQGHTEQIMQHGSATCRSTIPTGACLSSTCCVAPCGIAGQPSAVAACPAVIPAAEPAGAWATGLGACPTARATCQCAPNTCRCTAVAAAHGAALRRLQATVLVNELAISSHVRSPHLVDVCQVLLGVRLACYHAVDGSMSLYLESDPDTEGPSDPSHVRTCVPPQLRGLRVSRSAPGVAVIMAHGGRPLSAALHQESFYHDKATKQPYFRAILDTLLAVVHGLRVLHDRGLAHCDLKPANVLIKGEAGAFQTRLCDYGFSCRMERRDANGAHTLVQYLMGTRIYMAPELAVRGARADTSVDVYAFGLLMYEMYTCSVPFVNHVKTVGGTFDKITSLVAGGLRPVFPTPQPGSPLHAAPRVYQEMAACCWDPDPRKRPQLASIEFVLQCLRNNLIARQRSASAAFAPARASVPRPQPPVQARHAPAGGGVCEDAAAAGGLVTRAAATP